MESSVSDEERTGSIDRHPNQAPLHWGGGRWFMVRDYPKMDQAADAVKSFIAGGGAGMLSKTVVAPAERLKVLLQTERLLKGTTTPLMKLIQEVYSSEGLIAFWRGNWANCVRIIPNKGILFLCNDVYVKWFTTPGQRLSDFRRLLAGSLSGATLITCTYPLEMSFTVLSASNKSQYRGIFDVIRQIAQREGVIGLYRGYWASLMGIVPYNGAQFLFYEKLTALFRDEKGQTTVGTKLLCGATAGCAAQAITYPTDTIRRRLQVQAKFPVHHPPLPPSTQHSSQPITTTTTPPSATTPHTASPTTSAPITNPTPSTSFSTSTSTPLTTNTPDSHNVEHSHKKKKIETKYKGTWDCIKKIYIEEGYRGFYRGLYINCLRAMPSQAVQFATYSYLKEVLGVSQ